VEAVAAGDHVARELDLGSLVGEAHERPLDVDRHVGDLEQQRQPALQPRRDQVLDHLLLPVDGDRLAAGQRREVDPVPLPAEPELDPLVDHPLRVEAVRDPCLGEAVDRPLLEHPGAHALLDVLARAGLDDHRGDAAQLEQPREHQAGRPRSDDAHLRLHLCPPLERAGARGGEPRRQLQ
jgi:hypothetical protein